MTPDSWHATVDADQTRDIDAWRSRIHRHIDEIRAGILDLIDCGIPEDNYPRLRKPTEAQQAMTRHEKATPTSPKVNTGERSDHPARDTIRWAHAIWRALTDVDQLVGTWMFHTTPAGLPLPPAPTELREVPDPELDGRVSPRLHPKRASRLLLARVGWTGQRYGHTPQGWLPEAVDAIAEAWAEDPQWRGKALSIESATQQIARRHSRSSQTSGRCDNPHGLTPHPTDRPGVCTECDAADTIRRCNDRYGYDCDRFIVDEPQTYTCNPCQQRAYRQRRAVFAAAWGEDI